MSTIDDRAAASSRPFIRATPINFPGGCDPITRLPNRHTLTGQLDSALARQRRPRAAVVMLDIERFRFVNAALGRVGGDQLLREVAEWLCASIPDSDFIANIHADCFVVVLHGVVDEPAVVALLEGPLATRRSEVLYTLACAIHVSLWAGVAFSGTDGDDANTLLYRAELALKKAKTSRTRYVFYSSELDLRASERLAMEHRMRLALSEERFVLHYQPRIDTASHRMVGLEALLRWDDPEIGLIAPAQFIPLLEETGLIVEVGNWVIARAHGQYQHWLSRGLVAPRIAVNVSQLQIRQHGFVDSFLRLAGRNGAELEIEVTESQVMEDPASIFAKLTTLRQAGVSIAVDDFGTGYSSLSHLSRLPVDVLKIDREFIVDIAHRPDLVAIVSTIVALARSLRLVVVAEGVETFEQLEILRGLGCDQIQGFVHSPALPPEQIEHLMINQIRCRGTAGPGPMAATPPPWGTGH